MALCRGDDLVTGEESDSYPGSGLSDIVWIWIQFLPQRLEKLGNFSDRLSQGEMGVRWDLREMAEPRSFRSWLLAPLIPKDDESC